MEHVFSTTYGYQEPNDKGNSGLYAMALYVGNVGAVPEPINIMLRIMGLASITAFKRLRRK